MIQNDNNKKKQVCHQQTLNGDAQIFNCEVLEAKLGAGRPGHEQEEERIQAGVEATQARRHFEVHVQPVWAAGKKLHVMEEVQGPGRGEAHQEDDEHQRAGPDVRVPVVVGAAERAHDAPVAHGGDDQRQQESDGRQEQVVEEQEEVRAVAQWQHVVAGGAAHLGEPVALPHQQLWDGGGRKQAPHGHAHPGRVHPLGETLVLEGVHHRHVALDADAGQRLGRAVQVAIETGGDHPAGGLPEHPVVSMEMVVGLEDQREEQEEVGDGQAAVEDGRGHLPDLGGQRTQDGHVGRHPDGHRQHVDGGDDPGAEGAAEESHRGVAERPQARRARGRGGGLRPVCSWVRFSGDDRVASEYSGLRATDVGAVSRRFLSLFPCGENKGNKESGNFVLHLWI